MLVRLVACVVTLVLLASTGGQATAAPSNPQGSSGIVAGEILVKLRPGTPGQTIADIHRKLGGTVKDVIPGIEVQVVRVPAGQEAARAAAYERNPNVEFAEPNGIYQATGAPDDPRVGEQWAYENTGQTGGTPDADIDAFEAWDVTGGNESIAIAILDTGIDHGHVDFQYGGVDNNEFSKIQKWVNFTNSPTVEDVHGHGTHVAGSVAAATNNGIGVAGVCPNCVLYNVKVLGDSGGGSWDGIAKGINWSADNGAKVINMSLGGASGSRTVQRAVDYAWSKGVVIVAAAGNQGSSSPHYPAYYAKVIAVAATNHNDQKSSFSNYGSWVDVAAPGELILSTTMGDTYASWSGTSMATPHVAGLAGLVWSTGYGTGNSAVRNQIEATADAIAGTGSLWTHGRINACQAVSGTCDAPSSGPSVTIASPLTGAEIADVSSPLPVHVSVTDIAGSAQVDVSIDGGAWQPAAYNEATGFYESEWVLADASNGPHTIRAKATDGSGTTTTNPTLVRIAKPVALPSSFEAEDYRPGGQNVGYSDYEPKNLGGAYWNDGVDKESCADTTTCYNVGWVTNGEWLAYDASFAQSGNYAFTFRVSSPHSNATIRVELLQADGATFFQSDPIAVPETGGWQNWTDLTTSAFPIEADSYTLRLVAGHSGSDPGYLYNLNFVTVAAELAPDSPPSVSISSPIDGATVAGPVTVTAEATDDDGVSKVEFFVDGVSIGTDIDGTGGWSISWDTTQVIDGTHSLTATATDTAEQPTTSAPVSVTVDNVNDSPTAKFSVSCDGLNCDFDATSSTDPDGVIESYDWEFGDNAAGSGVISSHTYAEAGAYIVTLTVTDNKGATGASSQEVTVSTLAATMHVADLDGSSANAGSSWAATVTITVHDANHAPIAGARVTGTWNGSSTVVECTTGDDGTCSLTSPSVPKRTGSLTFTVDNVSHASFSYDAGDNHDPDGDSNGTSITIAKP
ncbi:MAG TPA: S8 family serine peptidase [Thermomicrobiales bacterium]|nr:S8 family serine peptidase [Thermomicrobiales bacterium]